MDTMKCSRLLRTCADFVYSTCATDYAMNAQWNYQAGGADVTIDLVRAYARVPKKQAARKG